MDMRGGSRGEGTRSGRFGGRRGGGGDRFSRFEGFLRRMDTNGDGVIREDEVPEERQGMLRMMSMRMGQDPAKGISIDKLRETMGGGGDRNHGRSSSPEDPSAQQDTLKAKPDPKEEPLVPGFGTDREPTAVATFGVRIQPAERIVLGTEPKLDPRIRAMFDRFDRNHNGTLEHEEWRGLPGNPAELDLNQDGKITLAEVASRFAQRQNTRQRDWRGGGHPRMNADRGSDDGEEEEEDSTAEQDRRGSYRFLSASERLPEGLPDWFTARDDDLDGQVTMAEYSRSWTRWTVAEYYKYDGNRDGVITPEECLHPADGNSRVEAGQGHGRPAKQTGGSSSGEPSKPWWQQ
ncbi:MAG: hypothetical protein JW888_10720 [Pirellulales bacterium]|nr:hypothetical protein [Pirellulales bacterium]